MIVPNQRNRVIPAVARTAANAAAYVAGRMLGGAVNAAGARASRAARDYVNGRYSRGDVNQPNTANTTQQLAPIRPRAGRRAARGGGASIVETGSLKLADVTTPGTTSTSCAVMSIPLVLDSLGGRIFQMSKLYSRWKFNRAILRYVPAVSSATDGSMVVYYTQEPDDIYLSNEPVGAGNAASAIDNMEFSVREKMSMGLHLPSQLLYTTAANQSERTWHSAGVVNVVNNGALVINKTYGSLYLDFSVTFSQPCAPYDVYSPLGTNTATFTPHGPGATGTADGALINYVQDFPLMSSDSGPAWVNDPRTGGVNTYGAIYLPPSTTCRITGSVFDSAAVNANVAVYFDTGVVALAGGHYDRSTDNTVKTWNFLVSNNGSTAAGFILRASAAGGWNCSKLDLSIEMVPYRPA